MNSKKKISVINNDFFHVECVKRKRILGRFRRKVTNDKFATEIDNTVFVEIDYMREMNRKLFITWERVPEMSSVTWVWTNFGCVDFWVAWWEREIVVREERIEDCCWKVKWDGGDEFWEWKSAMMNKRNESGVGRIRCRVLRIWVGGDLWGVVTSQLPLMEEVRERVAARSFSLWNEKIVKSWIDITATNTSFHDSIQHNFNFIQNLVDSCLTTRSNNHIRVRRWIRVCRGWVVVPFTVDIVAIPVFVFEIMLMTFRWEAKEEKERNAGVRKNWRNCLLVLGTVERRKKRVVVVFVGGGGFFIGLNWLWWIWWRKSMRSAFL